MANLMNPVTGQELVAAINGKLDSSGGIVTGDTTFQSSIKVDRICDKNGSTIIEKNDDKIVGKDGVSIGQIVTGIYTGDGEINRTIELGFRPDFVLVYPQKVEYFNNTFPACYSLQYLGITPSTSGGVANSLSFDNHVYYALLTTDTEGFQVYCYDDGGGTTNKNHKVYNYIAVKCM